MLKNNNKEYMENKRKNIKEIIIKLKNKEISIENLTNEEKYSLIKYFNIQILNNKEKIKNIKKYIKGGN